MRFRSAVLAAAALAAATFAHATPETVRAELLQRLQSQVPGVAVGDLARGAAAFDPELRAQVEAHAREVEAAAAAGKSRWQRRFKDGKSLAAASYPLFDSRLKRVVTLEMAINQCLKSHGEALLDPLEPEMAQLVAYVRSLAANQKVAVRMPAAAAERFEQGRRLYFTRLGQRNYACASCHVVSAAKHYGDETLSSPIGQAAHGPQLRGGAFVTLQARMRECLELMGAAPFPAGSDELNHLEYFLASLANGLAAQGTAWRPAPSSTAAAR